MSDTATTGIVDGESTCRHERDQRRYLGNMGSMAMYQCEGCGGVLLSWGAESST